MENLNENLKRIGLLMSYNNKLTLTENQEKLEIISEQPLKSLARGAESELRSVLKDIKQIQTSDGAVLKNVDDIIKAGREGKIVGTEMGRINRAILKNTTNQELKKLVYADIANSKSFNKTYASKTEAEVRDSLINRNNHTAEEAEGIINAYKQEGKEFGVTGKPKPGKPEPGKPEPKPKTEPKPITEPKPPVKKPKPKNPKVGGRKQTRWQKFKNWIKKNPYKTIITGLLAAGGLYLLYKWLSSGESPFPCCIINLASEEEIKKMADEQTESLIVGDVGNSNLNKLGGGVFFINKTFKTGNGQFEGTWDVDDNGTVKIDIGGTEYPINCDVNCDNKEDEDDDDGGDDGDGRKKEKEEEKEKDCSSLPMTMGCKDTSSENYIRKIQACFDLPESGKFDESLKNELSKRGYSSEINQSTYDKIMKDCLIKPDMSDSETI